MSLGFVPEALTIPVSNILPSRKLPDGLTLSLKYKQIQSSIEEVGLIEPLSVAPVVRNSEQHLLLDGHLRLMVLRALGHAEVPCLLAKDDEAYTYNSRINRLSTIQEHVMICRAIERGVSQERLAKALSVDVSYIIKRKTLLDGICPEAIELLNSLLKKTESSPGIW
jgi:ParB-like chromosome segregation protein Spo0J